MSDQDFFFDEDDQPSTPAKAAPAKKGGSAKAADAPAPAATTVQTVTMSVAALIGVIALLGGVIIGILLPIGPSSTPTTGNTATTPSTTGGNGSAPQLSPEQLQGGQLPAGHPDIGGGSGASTSTGK